MVSNNGHGRDYLAPRKTSAGGAARFASGPALFTGSMMRLRRQNFFANYPAKKTPPTKGQKPLSLIQNGIEHTLCRRLRERRDAVRGSV
jgi:hypothetical protein